MNRFINNGRIALILFFITLFLLTSYRSSAEIIISNINGELLPNRDVLPILSGYGLGFSITSDNQYALFVADIGTDDVYNLYSVPVDGSAPPTQLSDVLAGAGILDFDVTSDNVIVYKAAEDPAGMVELFRVDIDGTNKTRVNNPFVENGLVLPDREVASFQISPDGEHIIYRADHSENDQFEIFAAQLAGGNAFQVNGNLIASGDVITYKISLDSSRVIYLADQEADNVRELYSAPIFGGPIVKLNGPLIVNGGVRNAFYLTQTHVIYRADQDSLNVDELYSVPVEGGASIKLHPDLNGELDVGHVRVHPERNYVVYRADQENDEVFELYSVRVAEPISNLKLNSNLPLNGDVEIDFEISPDGNHVVYLAEQEVDTMAELFVTPIDDSRPLKRNSSLVQDGNVSNFQVSSDGQTIVYRADQEVDDRFELYSVSLEATDSPEAKLNLPLPLSGDVTSFSISDSNQRVLFIADDNVNEQFNLFSVPLNGGIALQINDPLLTLGGDNSDVIAFVLSPDESITLYVADENVDETFELFAVSEMPPLAEFSLENVSQVESASVFNLTVVLSEPSLNHLTVNVQLDGGSAEEGVDFLLPQSAELNFAAGEVRQTFPIELLDDELLEGDESIVFQLGVVGGGVVLGSEEVVNVTIIDNESGTFLNYLPLIQK